MCEDECRFVDEKNPLFTLTYPPPVRAIAIIFIGIAYVFVPRDLEVQGYLRLLSQSPNLPMAKATRLLHTYCPHEIHKRKVL